MPLKLSSKLPSPEHNGLTAITAALVEQPERMHAVIVLVDCKDTRTDHETGDVIATARIRRAEVICRPDLETAEKLLRRALEARSGMTVLPLDLEDELTAAFSQIDPATGEPYADLETDE